MKQINPLQNQKNC